MFRIPQPRSDNYKTSLIEKVIHMAVWNYDIPIDAIFRSDRGSDCTSRQFGNALKSLRSRQSVGRAGVCYDNSMAESFFATLKNECVHRTDIARYIELRYNSQRLHSGLGYKTPNEVYNEYLNRQQAG